MLQEIMRRLLATSIGSLTLLSIGIPVHSEDKLDNFSFWYGFVSGSGASICSLLKEGIISKSTAEQFSEGFMKGGKDDMPRLAVEDAVKVVQARFKGCPFK
ncbi:hypothetical protein WB44_01805 [Synechococcus sp. WH 8020]|nr:hypothetical protein WB44_01805 [Synechococcus sp. WH 8020]